MDTPNRSTHIREPYPRIRHIGIWVAYTFAWFGVFLAWLHLTEQPIEANLSGDFTFRLKSAVFGIIYGATFAAATSLLHRTVSGDGRLSSWQPGHWIVMWLCFEGLAGLLVPALLVGLDYLEISQVWLSAVNVLQFIVLIVLFVAIMALSIWHLRGQRCWQLYFIVVSAYVIAGYVLTLALANSGLPDLVRIPLLLILSNCVAGDLRQRRQRGWLHYVGVISSFALYLWLLWVNYFAWLTIARLIWDSQTTYI